MQFFYRFPIPLRSPESHSLFLRYFQIVELKLINIPSAQWIAWFSHSMVSLKTLREAFSFSLKSLREADSLRYGRQILLQKMEDECIECQKKVIKNNKCNFCEYLICSNCSTYSSSSSNSNSTLRLCTNYCLQFVKSSRISF